MGYRCGQGPKGRGRGGIPREEKTQVGFKTERGKVAVGKGGISGAFLVDGEQVPGEVGASVSEVVSAAERDASDRIKRDRIPTSQLWLYNAISRLWLEAELRLRPPIGLSLVAVARPKTD